MVTVLPITHSAPDNPDRAIEIPAALKRNLGLDDLGSWIVVGEGNQFLWPGFDLRPAGRTDRIDYGFLPPRLLRQVREAFVKLGRAGKGALDRAKLMTASPISPPFLHVKEADYPTGSGGTGSPKDQHTPTLAINALGVAMTVPMTTGGAFARNRGLTVPIYGHDTTGVAVCNQVRTFDIDARMRAGSARYIETLDAATTDEIVSHVLSVIDPGDPKPKPH